jgi:hypothetical protein
LTLLNLFAKVALNFGIKELLGIIPFIFELLSIKTCMFFLMLFVCLIFASILEAYGIWGLKFEFNKFVLCIHRIILEF